MSMTYKTQNLNIQFNSIQDFTSLSYIYIYNLHQREDEQYVQYKSNRPIIDDTTKDQHRPEMAMLKINLSYTFTTQL